MSNETISQISVQQLKQVIALREKIEALESQIAEVLGGKPRRGPGRPPASVAAAVAAPVVKGRRKMSAAARKRIAAAAKARWAKAKAAGRSTLKGT